MAESSPTPQTSASTQAEGGTETFYLGYQRDGKWRWRRLTAGTGDEDVRAVFFVGPGGQDDWPEIPGQPEDVSKISGFAKAKPPTDSLEQTDETEGVQPTEASASTRSICYWVDGKLYCDQAS